MLKSPILENALFLWPAAPNLHLLTACYETKETEDEDRVTSTDRKSSLSFLLKDKEGTQEQPKMRWYAMLHDLHSKECQVFGPSLDDPVFEMETAGYDSMAEAIRALLQ